MNGATKYLRFVTYGVLFVAIWFSHGVKVIPVDLVPSPVQRADDAARAKNVAFADAGILGCRRSGSEVMSIAQAKYEATVKSHTRELYAAVPEVRLESRDGRVIWVLIFELPGMPPGGRDVIIDVDDLTGEAVVRPHPGC